MAAQETSKGAELAETKPVAPQGSVPQEGSSEELGQRIELPALLRDYSEEELNRMKRHLVRKLDIRLMGPLILMYIMNYLDR